MLSAQDSSQGSNADYHELDNSSSHHPNSFTPNKSHGGGGCGNGSSASGHFSASTASGASSGGLGGHSPTWRSSLHHHLDQNLSRIITSLSNFSVQYNFQAIAIALIIMSAEECTSTVADCNKGDQASWVSASSSAVVFAGAITGQLFMGYLGDALGRDQAMTITLSLASLGALLSAVVSIDSKSANLTYLSIVASRFVLGIGLGGVYPLSATKAAEDGADDAEHEGEGSHEAVDSLASAKAFFWQAPGSVCPWIIAYILTYSDMTTDAKWRLLLGLGAVPAAIVALLSHYETKMKLRMQIMQQAEGLDEYNKWHPSVHSLLHSQASSSDRASALSASGFLSPGDSTPVNSSHSNNIQIQSISVNSEHGAHDSLFSRSFSRESLGDRNMRNSSVGLGVITTNHVLLENLNTWKYQKALIATGGGWFLYDVAYYGVNLFGGAILAAINDKSDDNITSDSSVRLIAGQQLVALGMGVPACILTIVLLKPVGTKSLQIYGFFFMAFMFALLAALFGPLQAHSPDGLYAIYCTLLFSLSFGPNVTTYILSAETYPKQTRATFNGISAAMGKLGAVVGASLFKPIVNVTSYPAIMVICAVLSVLGGLISIRYIDGLLVLPRLCVGAGAEGADPAAQMFKKRSSNVVDLDRACPRCPAMAGEF